MQFGRLALFGCLGVGILVATIWSSQFSPKSTASHVSAAINYHNEAAAIANKPCGTGAASVMSPADWKAIYSYDKQALQEAKQADVAGMNRHYPGFGDHWKNEFVDGLTLIVEDGNDSAKAPDFLRGQLLVHRFGDWFAANEDAIRGK